MKAVLVAVACVGLLGACSGGEGEGRVSPAPELSGASSLPASFPVPQGAEQTSFTPSGAGMTALFTAEVAQGSILSFFDEQLRRNGWRIIGSEPTELLTTIRFAGNGWSGQVTVVKGPPTQIAVVMHPEPTTGG